MRSRGKLRPVVAQCSPGDEGGFIIRYEAKLLG